MAVPLAAARTLVHGRTQDQGTIREMAPEQETWEFETGLQGNHSPGPEISRLRFRQLCSQETRGPLEPLSRLWVLCCEWLRPERHTEEQILTVLPEMHRKSRGRGRHLGTSSSSPSGPSLCQSMVGSRTWEGEEEGV